MNSPSAIIRELAATSSRLEKEAILDRVMREDSDEAVVFVQGAMRAFDTFETFGVKTSPQVYHDSGSEYIAHDWALVTALLDDLSTRHLTGHAALTEIDNVAHAVDDVEWNGFYSRVLLKDLKCGVNVSTWNKVAKKVDKAYVVPVFSCQLAHDGAKVDSHSGKKLVQVKLDGVRVITIVYPDGKVEMFSRNGKPLVNFPKIAEEMAQYAVPNIPIVFDGEVMSSSFQDLMKQVNRKEDVQTDDACLYLFDHLTLEEFKEGKGTAPQFVRAEILANSINESSCVKVVDYTEVDLDTQIGQRIMRQINERAIQLGYEGIMLKDYLAPYECKRTKSWLKIKPRIEVTLEVVDFEQGTGKNVGSLGALVCRGTDTGREISVNVGSGFSDALRNDIWSNKGLTLGMEVEVYADAITQNQDGTYSLRFPRFKCFRGFEPGEKL